MDPFSVSIFILGAAASGIIGSRSDKALSTVMHTVTDRLRRGGPPVSNELQQAVYKAYLQATLTVCEARLKALGVSTSTVWRNLRKISKPSPEVQWFESVRHAIKKEVHQLPDADYLPPSIEAERQVELLLQPKGKTALQHSNEFRKTLQQGLLKEFQEKHGKPPARFYEMIQQGWDDPVPDGTKAHIDWFDLLCAFFVHGLKENEQLRDVLKCQLLAELSVAGEPLTLEAFQDQFEKFGKEMIKRLESIDEHLAQLGSEQVEGFAGLQERLDETIPLLMILPEILEQLQFILREERRRLLYKYYTGTEVADRVEQLCHEHTTHFVGRDEKLRELDNFISENNSGIKIVTANAGFGKSALLANWVETRKFNGCFIAHHFFSQRFEVTRSTIKGCLNLLRQIYIYYERTDELLPDDENCRDTLIGILKERGTHNDEPLVVVIDALDEAKEIFSPPFPASLPDGIFVIVSARADEFEEPVYLHDWADGAERLHLTRLPRFAIANWLQRAGGGELSEFAKDESFVKKIDDNTKGFPLYLHHLIDELIQSAKQDKDVRTLLEKPPKGFKEYVEQQLDRIDELELPEQRWKFFALLTVTKGALRHDEVKSMTGMHDKDLRKMRKLWQVTRWLSILKEEDTYFYDFTHPLLSKNFAEVMGDKAEEALEYLMEWCARWQEHKKPYALRHYAEHLYDGNQWKELFALVKDETFTSVQAKVLPNEPDLLLKTIQTALKGAAETDNAEAMAEFLLLHARRLLQTRAQESPLNALREVNLQRAWELADLYDIQRCTLWHLLLSWELRDAGKLEQAQATLERLQEKNLIRLSDWKANYAAYGLVHLYDISEDAFNALHHQLLNDVDRKSICEHLIRCGRLAIACKIAQEITYAQYHAEALTAIAQAQAEAGLTEDAQTTFTAARETAQEIEDNWNRAEALSAIAQGQVKVDEFDIALEIAQEIKDAWHRANALLAIAQAQAEAGLTEDAQTTFTVARETAQEITNDLLHAKTLSVIAQAQAEAGLTEDAQTTFTVARETAQGITNDLDHGETLSVIAQGQVKVGEFDIALEIAQEIRYDCYRVEALTAIAQAQAEAGLTEDAQTTFTVARETAQEITNDLFHAKMLSVIAQAQAEAGLTEDAQTTFTVARETAQGITNDLLHAETLSVIAQAQAKVGEFDIAFEIAQEIEDAQHWTEVLSVIAQAQAVAGAFDVALETVQEIKDDRHCAEALSAIAQAQAVVGEFDAARETAQEIEDAQHRAEVLLAIAQTQAVVGEFDAARETAQEIEDAQHRAEVLLAIAQAHMQMGRTEDTRIDLAAALGTTQEIEDARHRANALLVIAQAQAEACLTEDAQTTFTVAREIAQEIKDARHRANALLAIAQAQAEAGLTEDAQTTFTVAREIAQEIKHDLSREEALSAIAQEQAVAGAFDVALEIAQEIEDARHRVEALSAIAQAQAEACLMEDAQTTFTSARKTVWEIKHGPYHTKALSAIAQAQAKVGEFDIALEIAHEIKYDLYRVEALSAIAQEQAEAGLTEDAQTTFTVARETAQEIEDDWSRAEAVTAFGQAQAVAGAFDVALEIAQEIEDARHRAEALSAIAQAQAVAGAFDAAREIAQEIEDDWYRANALLTIAQEQADAGAFDVALEIAQKIKIGFFRELTIRRITQAKVEAGFGAQTVATTKTILDSQEEHFPEFAESFVKIGDREHFKQLLIPCAYYLGAAYRMSGFLARLYPEQAAAVARIVYLPLL